MSMGEKTRVKSGMAGRVVAGTAALLVLLTVAMAISIGIGAEPVPIGAQAKVIGAHLFGSDIPADIAKFDVIIWQMRLPRVVLAVIVGVLLAAAGAALQGVLLNPLADPYTVGVSSGAAFGAAVAFIVPGFSVLFYGFGVPAVAFLFACAAMLVVYSLAKFAGRVSIHSFLLAGIVVGSFLWAALTFVLTIAHEHVATIVRWLLGSFADAPWSYVLMVLPFAVIGLAILYAMARDLNVYSLGEETARHLGIETETLKLVVIATTSLITAAAVSVSGIIGFVGLIVPHIARRGFGPDPRVLIPTAALSGAILMVLADTAARALGELPVGVITALIGAPFFLYLLRRQAAGSRKGRV
jgi:iron complex transport system permease protein